MYAFRDQPPIQRSQYIPPAKTPTEDRVYLIVSYDEKEDAKALGAKWDKTKKQWYAPYAEPSLVERWGVHARSLTELKGEDRAFQGSDLCIAFQPKSSSWCRKIQYAIHKSDRERVQDFVFGRVHRTCETCGVQDVEMEYHMHGRWTYDTTSNTQRLVRLMALCEKCYECTHFGTAHYNGRRDEARQHLRKIRKWSENECQTHVDVAYQSLDTLNRTKWTVDLSLLKDNGLKCESGTRKQTFFAKSNHTNTNDKSHSKQNKKNIVHRATNSTTYTFRSSKS